MKNQKPDSLGAPPTPLAKSNARFVKKYVALISLIVTLLITIIFWGFSHSVRKKLPLSIIIIDVDLFKQVNDNFGHQSGEEFLVVLPTTELAKAMETAERRVIKAVVIRSRNHQKIGLTISAGVSSLQEDDTLGSLLYRADNGLYIAKEEGRNQVQLLEAVPLSGAGKPVDRFLRYQAIKGLIMGGQNQTAGRHL